MFRKNLIAASLVALASGPAFAAVTADEAKQLGTTLTPVGAEKAANKEGTIPEWTGGLTTPPADSSRAAASARIRMRLTSRGSRSPARTWPSMRPS